MEVYREIKKDIAILILIIIGFQLLYNMFDIAVDDSDKDGWNRSGVQVIVDHKTGKEYLYKGNTLIGRYNERD